MGKVFISYSHDSLEHADKVLAFSNRLRKEGVDCILDQYEESPPEGWPRWMDRHIRDVAFVLMICTETYYKRVMGEEERGKGLGVRWEGNLIYQHIYNAGTENTRFIPVLFENGKTEHIATPLQNATRYWVDTEEGYKQLYRRLTGQPRVERPELGEIIILPSLGVRERKQDFFAPRIYLAKLPVTSNKLFGREGELKKLDDAWEGGGTNILSLVAWGGVGKSALVNEWLNQMEVDNWRGAVRVYGWSFYSQGTKEDRQASGDEFLAKALKWFGDEDEEGKLKSPWDKGVRLAELVREQKTLLVLDGLEPLQYPPGPMGGRLKDQGVEALLKELARGNNGLCVVTTREKVEDIEKVGGTEKIELENLSDGAGAAVLKDQGVKNATEKELRETSREFGGHALALNLLGSYLGTVHGGEIRKKDLVPKLTDDRRQGKHAMRVMESYEIWLREESKPELDILYMMGLFDRPAEEGAIDVLRKGEVIGGLTDRIATLLDADWKFAVESLRELRLLAVEDKNEPGKLDCHPLVREHFGGKLEKENPKAWKEGHGRLYEYYKKLPEKEQPDTLAEMEPLFAAVAHGCLAGRHQETGYDVFWERIKRGKKHYSTKKLGAFGADLGAVACFFERCWDQPAAGLTDHWKAGVLNWAGFGLRAVGRLGEAAEAMKASFDEIVKQENWRDAASCAGSLSELWLVVGGVAKAVEWGRRSVEYADQSKWWEEKMMFRTTLADALHQAGEVAEAEELFKEAEGMQRERQRRCEYLYSLWGYRFCDLLLGQGKFAEVERRASKTLEWAKVYDFSLHTHALDNLSLGRAYLGEALEKGTGEFGEARGYLERAVAGLREAGYQEFIIRGLLARAGLWRVMKDYKKAWADLAEAREIAERGGMKLHLADCGLEGCRLLLAEGKKEEAREELGKAKAMIEKMGYWRRDGEVEEIERGIEHG